MCAAVVLGPGLVRHAGGGDRVPASALRPGGPIVPAEGEPLVLWESREGVRRGRDYRRVDAGRDRATLTVAVTVTETLFTVMQ